MKKLTIKCALVSLLVSGALCSCSSEPELNTPGYGHLRLNLETAKDFTRAVNEADYTNVANYTVELRNDRGDLVGSYRGDNVPSSLLLPIGTYSVKAYYGTESAASRNSFLCTGTNYANILSDGEAEVTVTCSPTSGKLAAKFAPEMATYYSDYYITYGGTAALQSNLLTWTKTDTEPWYVLLNEKGETVTATIHLVVKDEYLTDEAKTQGIQQDGTVVKTYTLMRNKAWTLNIAPNYNTSKGILGGIVITIDESTNDQTIDIDIPAEWGL
ncbi:MAG: DUF4493 domain-containing protein [Bacteroidaceae bacterium]|nr:DUF4493 domain-containing protein [Bacteroidaceae bacterium]